MIHLLLTLLLSPWLRWRAGPTPVAPRRILVIQLAKIGDLLCSTPVFRELKRRHPQAHLAVMATRTNAPLLACNPHVDAVVTAEARDFRGIAGKHRLAALLRTGGYDTVVCLNAGAAYATAALWAGIPRRLAVLSNFGGATHRLAAKLWSDVEPHRGDRLIQETYLALLTQLEADLRQTAVAAGQDHVRKDAYATSGAPQKAAALLPKDRGPLLGIGVSSANRLKALGSERIVEIARQMVERFPDLSVVLIGGPEDKPQAAEIGAALPAGSVIDACGAVALAELPELLRRLDAFLGVDSGVTYMADAVGVPLVSVAGPCNMAETRPLGARAVILLREELPCRPCAHIFRAPYTCRIGTRECITGIDTSSMVDALATLLAPDETHQKSVHAEPLVMALDRPVEARAAPAPGFDKPSPDGGVLDRRAPEDP